MQEIATKKKGNRQLKITKREKSRFILHAAEKRFLRSIRKKSDSSNLQKKRTRKNTKYIPPIEAPAKIDIYREKNHRKFVEFIEELRRLAKQRSKKIFISFKNTQRITAAAGLLLVAETDRIVRAFPEISIKCSFPPLLSEGRYKTSHNFVESALKQIGFFKLINQHSSKLTNQTSVRRWRQLSGNTTDGSLAASLLSSLSEILSKQAQRKMYRGAIEAIANCVEHAYPKYRKDELGANDDRWWMLVGVDEENISVIVCDLGVGIPETLPRKHPNSLISKIFSKFRIQDNSDGELIRASTYIRRTRTELTNRGKGGQDFRSIIDTFPSAQLSIRSNRGVFTLTGEQCRAVHKERSRRFVDGTNHTESVSNYKGSIRGTLIEWVLSTKEFVK